MSIWDIRFSGSKKRPLTFDEALKASGIIVEPKKPLTFDEALKMSGLALDEWKTINGARVEIGEGGEILHGFEGKFKNINDVPRNTVKQREGESIEQTHERAREVFEKQDAEKAAQGATEGALTSQVEQKKQEQKEWKRKEKEQQKRAQELAAANCQSDLEEVQKTCAAITPNALDHEESSSESFQAVAFEDHKGFCASCCAAYVARQYLGLNVTAGRPETQGLLAGNIVSDGGLYGLSILAGGTVITKNDYYGVGLEKEGERKSTLDICKQALSKMKRGKEYVFCGGRHAAVVRLDPDELEITGRRLYQFLEMQTGKEQAGWRWLSDGQLKQRFRASTVKDGFGDRVSIVEAEKLAQYQSFRDALPYVNKGE